jgi:U3 small nucleolar RNA-associated protein 14
VEEEEGGRAAGADGLRAAPDGLRAALNELDREEHGDQDDADADDWMSAKPSKAQQSLLNDAFGGQDGDGLNADEFADAKSAAVEAEMPKLEDALKGRTAALPGWGGWSDTANPFSGFQKKLMKSAASKVEQQRRALSGARTDSRLKGVIINEKVDKRFASKYSIGSGDVPFPFTSREQYERSMRQPLGREWNTAGAHSKLVTPKVTTKGGVIIQPLKNGKMSASQKTRR